MLVNYFIVGGLVTLADVLLYNFLSGGRLRLPWLRANVISTSAGMLLGFSCHFVFVFHPVVAHLPVRMLRYFLTVGCSVYGVQNIVIYALGEVWPGPVRFVHRVVGPVEGVSFCTNDFVERTTGKCAATLAGMVWNFVLFKYVVYA